MSDERPIGIFDSGLGGLTVARELFRLMPGERIIYLGDTARCPYGSRSEKTIQLFGRQDATFLMEKEIKMLIVACNTVSSVALDHIRSHMKNLPVIGVVAPGARAAVLRTAEKKIGVIGTRATVGAGSYTKAIQNIDKNIQVFGQACPLFVPLVEEGLADSDICRKAAQHYLYDLVDSGIDCLILGCTHYPVLMEVILETVGTRIELIDSALWTAKEAQDILTALNAISSESGNGLSQSTFYITDKTPTFEKNALSFLGEELGNVECIDLERIVC